MLDQIHTVPNNNENIHVDAPGSMTYDEDANANSEILGQLKQLLGQDSSCKRQFL